LSASDTPQVKRASSTPTVAIVGGTGLVGRACASRIVQHYNVKTVAAPRLEYSGPNAPPSVIEAALSNTDVIATLSASFEGCTAVVNASGLAAPLAPASAVLSGANALTPATIGIAAARAGVRRLIHISSAAVQGRRRVLDDSANLEPATPYGCSKALGESTLEALRTDYPALEIVIYRPTSVLFPERDVTRHLGRTLRRKVVPIAGTGDAPQPFILPQQLASAVMLLLNHDSPPARCVHPMEGPTVSQLVRGLGRPWLVLPIPLVVFRIAAAILRMTRVSSAGGIARRIELFALGQEVRGDALMGAGYAPEFALEDYGRLMNQGIEAS